MLYVFTTPYVHCALIIPEALKFQESSQKEFSEVFSSGA